MYHPFTVFVLDNATQKAILKIPCAELETAHLVQKNLQSLFPQANVLLNQEKDKKKEALEKGRMSVVTSGFEELEKDLFNDVA